ncbi:MAG: hypothetical protein HZB15_05455 [Actinobacteria bacterium]|nr:hypothetical protein [Actinomycetota bacterium]
MSDLDAIAWPKPGPGAWTHDGAHNVTPVTPILQEVFPSAMAEGFRSFTGRYGLPISHIEVRYVNGRPYGSVRIAGVPASDRPPPPAWLLRVLTRVHPEFRRRNRNARVAADERVWHSDLRRWFDEFRPARLASLLALQAVDVDRLTDDELAAHVEACVAELAAGLREHFSLVGAAGLPVGLYVLREAERGRAVADALADLEGAASGSTAATVPALAAVAAALTEAGVEPSTLAEARAASPAACAALDAYLDEYGQRVVGAFDVTGRRLVEVPDLVLRSILAVGGRERVEPVPLADGDPIVDDARLAIASRDDHAGICCTWPVGLLRRALLVAGERLRAGGRLEHPDHVLEMATGEVVAALGGSGDVATAATIAARADARRSLAGLEPPAVLGEVHPPPDPAVFPDGMRRMATAMNAFLAALDGVRGRRVPSAGGREHTGTGVGAVVHRGRAVVSLDPEDAMDRLGPGDVLVTTTTTPAFNCVLPVAGALVTAHGGLMSHAGLAARELGIPAVLGVVDAHVVIPDGAEVEVDPASGTVRLV